MKQVVSNARKLVFTVENQTNQFSVPNGINMSEYGHNNYYPNILVVNGTDNSVQGVKDGGIIIVNNVPEEVSERVLSLIEGKAGQDKNFAILQALYFLANFYGYVDQYTSDIVFLETSLSPAGITLNNARDGLFKRDERDIFEVYFQGFYYVRHKEGDRKISEKALLRDYRNPDGSYINLNEISGLSY